MCCTRHKRLLLPFALSCLLHSLFFIPKKYDISHPNKQQITPPTHLNVTLQSTPVSTYKDSRAGVIAPAVQENIEHPVIYFNNNDTDKPARFKSELLIDDKNNENIINLRVNIWVNKNGKADKVVILDRIDDEYFRDAIIFAIKAASFEPAYINSNPVNSIMSGTLFETP